jgi:predicted transcriptional regulator
MVDRRQVIAGRALLEWTRGDLAAAAGVSMSALMRLEQGGADTRRSTLEKVTEALEGAGVEFLSRSDGSVGVMLTLADGAQPRD